MLETLNFARAKEGLMALDEFISGKRGSQDLPPFALPTRYHTSPALNGVCDFDYYLGIQTRVQRFLGFRLSLDQITGLGNTIYVIPHSEISRGQTPYYWLTLHSDSSENSPILTTCRLRPEEEKHKIIFQGWHGLEEQLLADYVLGRNNLRFTDLLPFVLTNINKGYLRNYRIAAQKELTVSIGENSKLQDGDILKFVHKTDDQRLYEWLEILKDVSPLPEERWPLICSYRLLPEEHRFYSTGWLGPERQLLLDRIQGRPEVNFEDLKPIIADVWGNGESISLFELRTNLPKGTIYFKPGFLAPKEKAIIIPKRDGQGIYEWLDLYSLNPTTKEPQGEILASGRITPDGINQRDWHGVEKQLLKDFIDGKISFVFLKPITFTVGRCKAYVNLWKEDGKKIYLVFSSSFNAETQDALTLEPEKETEEGADFILLKNNTPLARYRLNSKDRKFICLDNFVINRDRKFEYNPHLNVFVDEKGDNWITKSAALKRLGIAFSTLKGILESVDVIQYKWFEIDHILYLYSENELRAKAKESNIKLKVRQKDKSNSVSIKDLEDYEQLLLNGQIISFEEFMDRKERQK